MKTVIASFSGTAGELRDKLEQERSCQYWEGTGIYHRQDGPDDFVDVKCICRSGDGESND